MIKVAEIISDTNVGGAGILLLNRLKATDRTRFDTAVVLPKGSKLIPRLEKEGIKTVNLSRGADRSLDIIALRQYINALRRLEPQIVNTHGSLTGRIAAFLMGVPVRISTRHCVFPLSGIYRYNVIKGCVATLTALLSHCVIAVAHSAKAQLVEMGVPSNKIAVIINGAQPLRRANRQECQRLKQRLGIPVGTTVVTICARLEPCKDHNCFLRAAAMLCRSKKDFFFLVIGTGSREAELRQTAEKLGISDRVIFTGFVEDVAPYMSITDVNVNCSVGTETSSLALSEGMSLGVPAVVSDYGGNPYMVQNGKNGYVYKAGDSSALCRRILSITEDKEKYLRMSQAARERFEKELNSRAMTEKTQKLYEALYNAKNNAERS